MIDWNASAELNDCTVECLKDRFERFPKSHKKVVAVCDGGGNARHLAWSDYNGMCHLCSKRTSEAREASRLKTVEQFLDPAMREAARLRTIEQFSDQCVRDDVSKRSIEQWSDPIMRAKMSVIKKQFFIDNPAAGKEQSERLKKSVAIEALAEKFRGGNDIVMHHYLYDDADLSKHTMPMTRSDHGKMHRRMQLDGYKVSHINSKTDDNGLWGYR